VDDIATALLALEAKLTLTLKAADALYYLVTPAHPNIRTRFLVLQLMSL
jgi:hypothetical protein